MLNMFKRMGNGKAESGKAERGKAEIGAAPGDTR
jgi:hypothetical protein